VAATAAAASSAHTSAGEYCRRTCSVALSKLSRAVEEGRLAESDFLLGW
jgi:hypothetical protein